MKFTIKDFSSKELLKEIVLKKEDSITFKNTPIVQESPSAFSGKRIRKMEQTSKFLRKISAGDIGISAYKKNNQYRITLGSKKEIARGGAMMPMGGFGGIPLGGFGPLSVGFNPTFFAYGGYSSTKTTRIDCLFDNKFEHVPGDVPDNIFDKIKAFEDTFEDNYFEKLELRNLFWHGDKLYFGYISTKDRNYHLVEFTEN